MFRKRCLIAVVPALAVLVSSSALARPVAAIPADNVARFDLRVPADAQVWFDGAKTAQTGPYRRFVSPPLTPGRDYSYHVRVRWVDEDGPVEETRDVPVRAGSSINLAFPGRNPSEGRSSAAAPGAVERPSWYFSPAVPVPGSNGFFDSPLYSPGSPPVERAPHFYNPNDYPPRGGPPGLGVGQG